MPASRMGTIDNVKRYLSAVIEKLNDSCDMSEHGMADRGRYGQACFVANRVANVEIDVFLDDGNERSSMRPYVVYAVVDDLACKKCFRAAYTVCPEPIEVTECILTFIGLL